MKESKSRSLVKAIFYRLMHWFIHSTFFYVLTSNPIESGLLGVASNVVCFISYYLYERGWNKISWGREE